MKVINDIFGKDWELGDKCLGCEMANKKIECPFGILFETENFLVVQDIETPIPGFMVIDCKKHVRSILELSPMEYQELMDLCYKVRKSMINLSDIVDVTIIQKELAPHLHLWLFPRYKWMINNHELELGYGTLSDFTKIIKYTRANHKDDEHINVIKKSFEIIQKNM